MTIAHSFRRSPTQGHVWSLSNMPYSQLMIIILVLICSPVQQSAGTAGFVKTRNTQFVVDGSSPFLFNGFNSYWMMHVAAEPSERHKVSDTLREAAAAGLTVCRTWAFSDGGDRALQMSPGAYNEPVFQNFPPLIHNGQSPPIRPDCDMPANLLYKDYHSDHKFTITTYSPTGVALDFVISEAKKYGVRLILSLSNNYKDFGGRSQYVNWARGAGVPINTDDDFYTNQVVKGYYMNHVKRVLTRINTINGVAYKDDPTIMAWELMNEPRCQIDYSGKTLNGWVQEMASHVKSIDSNHLLEIGMEGFYGDSIPDRKQYNPGYQVGTDFISNNLIKEIDFATIHAYPDIWLSGQDDNSQMGFMQRWMTSHLTDSRTILKKPIVFSEFGKSSKDAGYSLNARDSFLNAIYTNIYNFARSGGGIGGGLVWQIMGEGMESYDDGYSIVLNQNPSTNAVVARQSTQMKALERTLTARSTRV